jgi:hypothetical protein
MIFDDGIDEWQRTRNRAAAKFACPSQEEIPFFSSDLVRSPTSGFEVDFIISDHTAVELKAKENLSPQDLTLYHKA